MKRLSLIFILFATAACIPACTNSDPPTGAQPPGNAATKTDSRGGEKIDFVTQVKPILRERCIMCHNKETMPNRHSFETRALTMEGDQIGPILIPGNPESSRLLIAVRAPKVHEQVMPPVSLRVTEAEIEILAQWIREGANWPEGKSGRIVPDKVPLE